MFLLHDDYRDVFYGGAAGGGKSDALLMAAAQYVHVPTYSALILRKSFADLSLPGAIMDRAISWWRGKARWNAQKHQFTFPSGATITFGYMASENDRYRYQSAEFQYIAFDELTQFAQPAFQFLFSRLRKAASADQVPLRMRSASNPPPNLAGAWVKHRYLSKECQAAYMNRGRFFGQVWHNDNGRRIFVPARMDDNPHLDQVSYRESLADLDIVTRKQQEEGDWTAHNSGRFHRSWFPCWRDIGDALIVGQGYFGADNLVHKSQLIYSMWIDPNNREKRESKNTCILVVAQDPKGRLFILEVIARPMNMQDIIPNVYAVYRRYPHVQTIGIEDNGFQIGLVNEARDRTKYPDMPLIKELPTEGKSKLTRATPAINMASENRIFTPQDPAPDWLEEWYEELELFTGDDKADAYTDRVDTLAYSVLDLKEQFGYRGESFTLGYGR